MKIDNTTYKDRKETQSGMIADHTSRPDKVLFFADPHFLFLNYTAYSHLAHLPLPQTHKSTQWQSQKSQIFQRLILLQ